MFFVLLSLICLSCKPEKEQLTGHWHVEDGPGIGSFDITDSLTIRRFVFEEGSNIYFPVRFYDQKLYYQYYDDAPPYDKSYPIRLKGDSLICTYNGFTAIRRPYCNLKKDYLSEMYVIVNLPILEKCLEINAYNTAFITMGKPQLYLHAFSGSVYRKDTILTQVNEVIISLSDIEEYLQFELGRIEENKLNICFNLDKDIPLSAIQNVVYELVKYKPVKKLYFACQSDSPELISYTGIEVNRQKLLEAIKSKEYSRLDIQQILTTHLHTVSD